MVYLHECYCMPFKFYNYLTLNRFLRNLGFRFTSSSAYSYKRFIQIRAKLKFSWKLSVFTDAMEFRLRLKF
jgi:hypothetical protein